MGEGEWMKTIGERIKFFRECLGLSQPELAKEAYCTTSAICQYENGARLPDLQRFYFICKALKIDYRLLLENSELSKANYIEQEETK